MPEEPTLNQTLATLGYGSRDRQDNYTKEIYRLSDGRVMGRHTASSCWEWIKAGCPEETER